MPRCSNLRNGLVVTKLPINYSCRTQVPNGAPCVHQSILSFGGGQWPRCQCWERGNKPRTPSKRLWRSIWGSHVLHHQRWTVCGDKERSWRSTYRYWKSKDWTWSCLWSLWTCQHGPTDLPNGQTGAGCGPRVCPLLLLPALLLLVGDHHPLCSDGVGPLQCSLCHYIPGGANWGVMDTRDLDSIKERHIVLHLLLLERWQKTLPQPTKYLWLFLWLGREEMCLSFSYTLFLPNWHYEQESHQQQYLITSNAVSISHDAQYKSLFCQCL